MPTVVVMDVSLSMTRPVSVEGSEEYQRKHLAVHGLTMLFEHMATNYKLEFTALVVFSSLWELMVPFTRDYNTLQVGCMKPQSSHLSIKKKKKLRGFMLSCTQCHKHSIFILILKIGEINACEVFHYLTNHTFAGDL